MNLFGPKKYDDKRLTEILDEIKKLKEHELEGVLDYEISAKEIIDASKSLKNNKAVGIDQIKNEMIKDSLSIILPILENIFNAILGHKHYPKEWKLGIIVNLFKSGDKCNTDNYRGLTINSCLGKLFNTVMNNRLVKFLDENQIIHDNQIGFKKKARPSDHIFILNTLFKKICKGNKKLYLCFVDFRKAYDTVWRNALLLKLLKIGIRGNFFEVIANMYTGGESYIKADGSLSQGFKCETGVRQGDVLSPNLFNIFINDLPDIFLDQSDSPMLGDKAIHCLMYADDLVLFSTSIEGLQKKIYSLKEYCDKWSLTINTKKTQVMAMASQNAIIPEDKILYGNTELKWVKSYKYLGIEIHNSGNMTTSTENLCNRAWKAVFKMKSCFKDVDINPKISVNMFDMLIRPILCYGCEIWGLDNAAGNSNSLEELWRRIEKLPIEKFQIKYAKGLLGVHNKACNNAVMGELGRYPIVIFVIQTMLRYIVHMDEVCENRPLFKAAILEDKELPKTKSWIKKVENILDLFKFKINKTKMSTYTSLSPGFIDNVIKVIKEHYVEQWKRKLGDTDSEDGKLSMYRKVKSDFAIEPYLTQIKKFKDRRSLTAIRISAHKLEIETGRYIQDSNREPVHRKNRYCMLCKEKGHTLLGDELHALRECPTFEKERQKVDNYLIQHVPQFKLLDNKMKMIYMLTCENEYIIRTSRFIHTVLSHQRPKFKNDI